MPQVSIGMPVFNGENYISDAIDSILDQTFEDFELIISDNASTDRTEAICRGYAQRDKRIHYYKNSYNIGAGPNFNKTFELSSGKYFKWAAHDDVCSPIYLQECVNYLNNHPTYVLCHSLTQWIDHKNQFIRDYNLKLNNIEADEPFKRFSDMISLDHHCFDIFGLIKTDILKKTKLIKSFIGADRALLVELCLLGKFHRIENTLFFSRHHDQRSIKSIPLHERGEWWDPKLKGQISFPRCQEFLEFLRIIHRVRLKFIERTICYSVLINWLFNNYRVIRTDIVIALKKILKLIQ